MDIFILRSGEQTGPFSAQTVETLLSQGAVRASDMAWRKGLPAWLPLSEVLNPGSQKPSEPPPAVQLSGVKALPIAPTAPTSKQKVLLKYLGVEFGEKATKEDLAMLVSDAIENPKLQARLAKWGEEKLRLHSDIFADEVEHRKGNRGGIYVERCQTEGEGVVRDVTKAHCQVLVESLDKRFPAWEANPKDALWQYFFPAIAEHFPTLVVGDWKSKLRFGSSPKGVPAAAARPGSGPTAVASGTAPGPLAAALRGVAYGLVALGAIIGGMQLFKDKEVAPVPAEKLKSAAAPAEPAVPAVPAILPDAPLIAAVPNVPAEPEVPATVPVPAPSETVPVPVPPEPAPAPVAPAMAEVPVTPPPAPINPVPPGPPSLPRTDGAMAATPAVPPTAPTAPTVTAPPAPPAPAAPKTTLTLTKPVSIQLQFGKVTLPPGTRMRFLGVEAAGVKCNFNNNIVVVPVTSTDYDGPLISAGAPVTSGLPAVPPAPMTPPAPKPVNSSDL
jgi:hypothetical protein